MSARKSHLQKFQKLKTRLYENDLVSRGEISKGREWQRREATSSHKLQGREIYSSGIQNLQPYKEIDKVAKKGVEDY